MRLKVYLVLFISVFLSSFALAQEETLTISTYYPSPYGSYNEFKVASNTWLAYSSGSVGIGTTGPTAHLQIHSADVQSTLDIQRDANTNNGMIKFATGVLDGAGNDWILGERNTGDSNFKLYSYGAASDVLTVLRSNGNVGIGMASPELKLTVTGQGGSYGAALFRNASYTNTFSILPHPGVTYLSSGIYYNGGWVQANDNSYNQLFAMDTANGIRWYASNTGTGSWNLAGGIILWNNSGIWVGPSSRTLKENFTHLNLDDILQKIDQLDLTRWNFKSEGKSITHIGPVAEDFYRIFKTGDSEKNLATIDSVGVALAGVKGLSVQVKNQQKQIQQLQEKISMLEAKLKK